MCGITGYIGQGNAIEYILQCLRLLQNRGYDSAGICTIGYGNSLICHKKASTETITALDFLERSQQEHIGHLNGIGHTRWATHGEKSNCNAHPHLDEKHMFAVVHNGIIDNYFQLKQMLITAGYHFISQTDTEVIAHLLAYHYDRSPTKDFEKDILQPTLHMLKGTWALIILDREYPNRLCVCRNGSPLLFGINREFV